MLVDPTAGLVAPVQVVHHGDVQPCQAKAACSQARADAEHPFGIRQPQLRVQTRSQPERDGGGECDGGQEVGGELVVAGCHPAEVLEAAERVLDQVAAAVAPPVMADGPFAVAAAGNDRSGALCTQRAAERIRVVSLVGDQVAHGPGAFEQGGRDGDVAGVACTQRQRVGATDDIGERVDLGGPAAARPADRLRLPPPFAPNAARWAFT